MSRISVMPSGVTVAGLGQRIVAAIVDAVPVVLINLVTTLITMYGNPSSTTMIVVSIVAGLLTLGWALYLWWGYATRGQGPGAKLMRIQVLGLKDGRPIGWGRYFLRELVWYASTILIIPWIVLVVMMVTHQRRQGWHDLAAKAVAVKRARVLESGGSVTRSSVQSANTVGLPPHLVSASFSGSGPSAELPSSIGYTPTALGSTSSAGPIASVPSGFAPATDPAADYQQQAPSYHPTPQPAPQSYQSPAPVPQPQIQPPHQPPSQAASAVPWDQWGAQAPGAQAYPQQPQAPVQPQGFAPQHQGFAPQQPYGQQAYAPGQAAQPHQQAQSYQSPQQAYQPQQPQPQQPLQSGYGQPAGYPAQAPPPAQAAQPPSGQQFFAAASDDFEGTHLASRSTVGPQRGADVGWQVRLDDGRVIDIDGLVLIGRAPTARPDEAASQLISAGADSRMVSKTHLALGTDHRGLYVSDRGSTNGTAVSGEGGQLEPCAPGDRVRLREGQSVSFGDRYFEVRRTHPA